MGHTPLRVSFLNITVALIWAIVVSSLMVVATAHAQSTDIVRSPILVIDSERLYGGSAFGQRVVRDQERLSADLVVENSRIEQELAAEELSLTQQRATTSPADFRELADVFDTKVQATRSRQLGKTKALTLLLEEQRVVFFQSAGPVIEALMREAGAAVLLDRREVFFSADAVDITDAAILRIDASLGEGTPLAAPIDAPQD